MQGVPSSQKPDVLAFDIERKVQWLRYSFYSVRCRTQNPSYFDTSIKYCSNFYSFNIEETLIRGGCSLWRGGVLRPEADGWRLERCRRPHQLLDPAHAEARWHEGRWRLLYTFLNLKKNDLDPVNLKFHFN